MWTAATVMLLALGAGTATAVAVRRRMRGASGRLRGVVAVVTLLAVSMALIEVWAHLMVDRSAVARAVAWLEADTGDLRRFPARPITAGDQPLRLGDCPAPEPVVDRRVETRGEKVKLAELLDRTRTTSFLVLSDDCVLAEHYGEGSGPDRLQTSFSMAKSILSTLTGIAIDRGEISSLEEPITTYLPELAERDERYSRITLRHLVTMSSGLRYEEHGLPWSDDSLTYYSPDLRRTALSAQVGRPPGEVWHYNNYNPLLMGLILERATGTSVADYMERHLWQPMGAEHDASWSLDSTESGFEKMESGVNATARDYARFGYLFAHQGRVAGRQVVPAAWVAEATAVDADRDPNPAYQHWWWIDDAREDRFYARGNFGQFVYVDAGADLVVVRTGTEYGIPDWPLVLRQIADELTARPSA